MGYNSIQYLTISNSSLANYVGWASTVGSQLSACGWAQASDTGQVVWTASVASITAATLSGSNTTYTYTLSSGPGLRVGMSIVVASMANSGNNGTFTITARGGGTFTVVNASGVTVSGQSGTGTVAAISTVPSSSTTRDYEVWSPNDSLQTGSSVFYLRIGYGFSSTQPYLMVAIGAATNGAGVLSGNISSTQEVINIASNQTNSSDCYFCGAAGRISFVFARSINNTSLSSSLVIERTKNSDGSDSTDGVYMGIQGSSFFDGVLVFGVGGNGGNNLTPTTILTGTSPSTSSYYNNSVALRPIFPNYGKFGYPVTGKMQIATADGTEGSFIVTNLYGQQRTYLVSGSGNMGWSSTKLLSRFD